MNEHLKFSWGHIIAFLALIVISYITFVGATYKTDGDFTIASIAMVAIDIILFVLFIGAQMMKATAKHFAKRIWVERILVFGSPIAFPLCMLPYYHFGTVQSQDEEIVGHFTGAITASMQMFSDYDAYSKHRIARYDHMLDSMVSAQGIKPAELASCGFAKADKQIQKNNMVKALRLQLVSENYDSPKTEATKWIEESSNGASTWNVFLLGNTKEIKKAIHQWNNQLAGFSRHKMSNEEFKGYNQVKTFSEASKSLASVDAGLDGLTGKFTATAFPPVGSILGSIVLYLALLFPYFLQDRHTKSQFRLIGMKKGASRSANLTIEPYGEDTQRPSHPEPNGEVDDYASFTL